VIIICFDFVFIWIKPSTILLLQMVDTVEVMVMDTVMVVLIAMVEVVHTFISRPEIFFGST